MLLRDMILEILGEGPPVTAAEVARRCGEDRVRCLDHLRTFRRTGLCFSCPNPRYEGDVFALDLFVRDPARSAQHEVPDR